MTPMSAFLPSWPRTPVRRSPRSESASVFQHLRSKRRVDRMLDSGVIRGFTTVVDRNAVGWNTEAYVQVFCHGRITPAELRAAWIDIPEIVNAATVTGTSDAILHVLARDMRHLEAALERIRSSAEVER